jgi:hypothetical protein
MISRRVTGMESSVMSSASRGEWLRYELLNELARASNTTTAVCRSSGMRRPQTGGKHVTGR